MISQGSSTRLRRAVVPLTPSAWSLRARLVIGVAVLSAVGLAVMGTLGVTLLRSYLVSQVDQQLAGVADVLRAGPGFGSPRQLPGTGLPEQSQQALPTPFVFTMLSSEGTVLSQAGGSVTAAGPAPDLRGLTATTARASAGHAFTVRAVGGASGFRVRAVVNTDGSVTAVALSLRASDATVRRLEMITLIVAVSVLALLIGFATFLVWLGLRPLRVVQQTAGRIAGGDLSRRVPGGPENTEVGRLAAALNAMLEQIESAFAGRARSEATLRQFIADASHELRTPLTTVRGYAELVNRGALADEQRRQHALQRIEAEAARMGTLVDDLLLLAYLDQQRPLQTSRADLASLVDDAVADTRARAPGRSIGYDAPVGPVTVEVDVDRMRQVLANLLSNAVVHTPSEASIRVRLERVDGAGVITVADDGPGVSAAQLKRLFERFYRGDPARSRSRGGTGLGLSIVAAVVAASGGTVRCDSTPGEGMTVSVALPLALS